MEQEMEQKMDTGISAVVTTPDELEAVLKDPTEYRRRGAVVVDLAALREMEHIGLVATAIFNPYGPTVETLSLASFGGEWEAGRTILLRRRLHPFYDTYIQIVTEIILGEEGWQQHLAAMLALVFSGNGRSEASRDWALTICEAVPSGVIITDFARPWTGEIRQGLAWVLQNADHLLREDIEKIDACGSAFWDQASWELKRAFRGISRTADPDASMETLSDGIELGIGDPPIASIEDINGFSEHPDFTAWWQRVATSEYQEALHTQLPGAWHGAIGQVPGMANRDNRDFDSWWKLFAT
jgi:hypothetical protein